MATTSSRSKTASGKAARAYAIVERRRKVALLLRVGLEQQDIATSLGCSAATVSGDVGALKVLALGEAVEDVRAVIAEEAAALDGDEVALRERLAEAKSTGQVLSYHARIMRIMERRAKLLGLDAAGSPLNVEGGTLDALLASLAEVRN